MIDSPTTTTSSVEEFSLSDLAVKEERTEHYEILLFVPGNTVEDQVKEVIAAVKLLIARCEGVVTHEEDWGRRELSYTVHHSRYGHYYLLECDLRPASMLELQHALRVEKGIARFLIVKKHVKTAAEIAEEERVREKIRMRREKQRIATSKQELQEQDRTPVDTPSAAQAPSVPAPTTPVDGAAPSAQPSSPPKTLEDIDKEIDRILGGDIKV